MAAVTLTVDAYAGPFAPVVDMAVTLPNGRIEHLTAPESGLAHLELDGVEYAFRPTIVDSQPWHHVVITIFRRPSPDAATQIVGTVELKTRGTPQDARSVPAFKVAVTRVSPPATNSDQ